MATKNLESVFSRRVNNWKDLELYQHVNALMSMVFHAISNHPLLITVKTN